jgi:hypothetical protein
MNKWLFVSLLANMCLFSLFITLLINPGPKPHEYGSAKYQIEYKPEQGASSGVVADCELRMNEQAAKFAKNPTPHSGDIVVTECRVREPFEPVWAGGGIKYKNETNSD